MKLRGASFLAVLAGLVAVLIIFVRCAGDGKDSSTSATKTPSLSSPEATAPSGTPDLSTIRVQDRAEVRQFAARLGGEVDPQLIIYADLTGDGLDEAIVPVTSGGTQGDFGFIVMGYLDGKLRSLLLEAPDEREVRVAVTNGQLVETLPVYAPEDQTGFPAQIKNIYYAWDDDHFVVDREETVPNPNPPPHA